MKHKRRRRAKIPVLPKSKAPRVLDRPSVPIQPEQATAVMLRDLFQQYTKDKLARLLLAFGVTRDSKEGIYVLGDVPLGEREFDAWLALARIKGERMSNPKGRKTEQAQKRRHLSNAGAWKQKLGRCPQRVGWYLGEKYLGETVDEAWHTLNLNREVKTMRPAPPSVINCIRMQSLLAGIRLATGNSFLRVKYRVKTVTRNNTVCNPGWYLFTTADDLVGAYIGKNQREAYAKLVNSHPNCCPVCQQGTTQEGG